MDFIATDKLLQTRPDTMKCIRKMCNLDDPRKLEEAVDIFYEWVQKQSHFNKKDFSRRYLEVGLMTNKGSIERAKRQLDRLCTLRTLVPEFFGDYNPKSDCGNLFDIVFRMRWFIAICVHSYVYQSSGVTVSAHFQNDIRSFSQLPRYCRAVILPKLTEDHYRVHIMKFYDVDWKASQTIDFYRYSIILAEYTKAHDYLHGYIEILDFSETSLVNFLTKLNPVDVRQAIYVFIEGYGLRLKGLHVISQSKLVDGLLKLIKQVLSPKLADRIIVHKSYEDIHEYVPKVILPTDYGGEERSMENLHEEWIKLLSSDEHLSFMREMNTATTNESRRQKDQFSENYAGMPGTFRYLSID